MFVVEETSKIAVMVDTHCAVVSEKKQWKQLISKARMKGTVHFFACNNGVFPSLM